MFRPCKYFNARTGIYCFSHTHFGEVNINICDICSEQAGNNQKSLQKIQIEIKMIITKSAICLHKWKIGCCDCEVCKINKQTTGRTVTAACFLIIGIPVSRETPPRIRGDRLSRREKPPEPASSSDKNAREILISFHRNIHISC